LKKNFAYIIIGVLVLGLVFLVAKFSGNGKHQFDSRITFYRKDKIPYGMYTAFQDLKYIFPKTKINVEKRAPGYWDSLSDYEGHQAIMIICPSFSADDYELKRLLDFAKNGNTVFISTRFLSSDAKQFFHCDTELEGFSLNDPGEDDSFVTSLPNPPFAADQRYTYPGLAYGAYCVSYDTSTAFPMGKNNLGQTNFLRFRTGEGNIYLHLEPMCFSNFFMLHRQNMAYYNQVLSVIPPDVTQLCWDEYYLRKKENENQSEPGVLSVLMSQRPFRYALLVLAVLLSLFALQEMRRKQRIIPESPLPRNASLDFVKTVGRLYYEKNDNRNLAQKMLSYFLEHVRNRYKLPTGRLEEDFIKNLKHKSGKSEETIRTIIKFSSYLQDNVEISDEQLASFHKQLELFYADDSTV
jgi:hypothetical protein